MTSKAVVSAQLPRVYEETSGGKVVPQNASQGAGLVVLPIGGTDFNAEELVKIAKETGKKLDAEVLVPIERWMSAFGVVRVSRPIMRRAAKGALPQRASRPDAHAIVECPPFGSMVAPTAPAALL
jgi:hypothetical protein